MAVAEMSEPIHCDFCGEAGASWLTLPDLSSAEQRHPLTGYACRKCALEQMTKASGGALIPAAPSAAVRETLLYRVLNSDAWRNNPQWQQAADVFGLPPAMRLFQLHNADNTLTPAGRTILAALDGCSGAVADATGQAPGPSDTELLNALDGKQLPPDANDLVRRLARQRDEAMHSSDTDYTAARIAIKRLASLATHTKRREQRELEITADIYSELGGGPSPEAAREMGLPELATHRLTRERDEARAAAVWLSKYCEEETDREYSRAHEDADTFLRDAYEATTGTVPNAQETTQE